jgi:hypothetical protein
VSIIFVLLAQTLLHIAVEHDHIVLSDFLLDRGADAFIRDDVSISVSFIVQFNSIQFNSLTPLLFLSYMCDCLFLCALVLQEELLAFEMGQNGASTLVLGA